MQYKFKQIADSYSYTDYKSVFGIYKNKKYKIISKRTSDTGRITVNAYVLTTSGYIELFNENDLSVNTNDYYVKTSIENYKDVVKEKLNDRINQAITLIKTIY